jgi:hypothetical protein
VGTCRVNVRVPPLSHCFRLVPFATSAAVREHPLLKVCGAPELSVVAFDARDASKLSIYAVADGMKARGWNLNLLQVRRSGDSNALSIAVWIPTVVPSPLVLACVLRSSRRRCTLQ